MTGALLLSINDTLSRCLFELPDMYVYATVFQYPFHSAQCWLALFPLLLCSASIRGYTHVSHCVVSLFSHCLLLHHSPHLSSDLSCLPQVSAVYLYLPLNPSFKHRELGQCVCNDPFPPSQHTLNYVQAYRYRLYVRFNHSHAMHSR